MRNYEFELVGFVPRRVLKAMNGKNRQDKNKRKSHNFKNKSRRHV